MSESQKRSTSRLLRLFFFVVPVAVFAAIWAPEIGHYYVPTVSISTEEVQKGRNLPEDSVLDEVSHFSFEFSPRWNSNDQLIGAAENILHGTITIPGFPTIAIRIPFGAEDIDKSPLVWQLPLACLIVPKVLLQAYRVTHRDDFLIAARDMILAWAAYEHTAWLPRGFLWNDHAIAARVLVVAEFWRLYRNHPNYQVEDAKTIFRFMGRSGELLAKPSHFTFATNHGIMQNLALWHLCLTFPTLPEAPRYRELALERLRDQMVFYISGEGVVLEHSLGYHRMGLELIAMAFRYMTLLDITPPNNWRQKYENALDFFAAMRRPDGSLPKLGDTRGGGDAHGPLVTRVDSHDRSMRLAPQKAWPLPAHAYSLYGTSGYSVWWQGLPESPDFEGLNQTVVAWSNFPGHGHKHADDMSVVFWAAGKSWWENVGYWPYEDTRRTEATSWGGSNAPHLIAEPAESVRETTLRSYGWTKDAAAIDMERLGPGDYVVRRQVIAIKPNVWIVLDSSVRGEKQPTTSTWTAASEVKIDDGRFTGAYELKRTDSRTSLTVVPMGSSGFNVRRLYGVVSPLAGWTVVGRTPQPTDALVLEQPETASWSAMLWVINSPAVSGVRMVERPYMRAWKSADEWQLIVPDRDGAVDIERQNGEILVSVGRRHRLAKLVLTEAGAMTAGRSQILAGYDQAKSKYSPRFRDLLPYRIKVTSILGMIFVLQEVFFLLYARIVGCYYVALRIFNVCGWGAVGSWLVLVYFQT
jgi:Heparinase II/III N-terminus/Heparinase II/III-like protein